MKLCFRIVVVYMFASRAATVEAEDLKVIEKRVKKEDVVLSATLPEKRFAGDRIELIILVKNQRKDDVVYYETFLPRDFNIAIQDPQGKSVPQTKFGQMMLSRGTGDFRRIRRVIPSGKDVKFRINISRFYDLTNAGEYNLRIEWTVILNESKPGSYTKIELKLPFEVSEPLPK